MKCKVILILLVVAFGYGCDNKASSSQNGFSDISSLTVKDSIQLERLGILNPHYIYYKNDFLIFNSMQGEREIQLLDLKSDRVTEFKVIGQGKNEMQNYHTVNNQTENVYMFADNRQRKIYEIHLDSLRNHPKTNYDLLLSLPNVDDRHFYRFLDLQDWVVGIGLLKGGRFGIYKKENNAYTEQMVYPENEEISRLGDMHKGILYSKTIMGSDMSGKNMVAACFGLIDFYSISEKGELKLKKSHHNHFPKFETRTTGTAISYKKEDKIGITGLCTDKNYVYVLYSDKTFEEQGMDAYNASCILVYDWNGLPVKQYNLSVPLYGFTVANNMIYGLSRKRNPMVYIMPLN